MRYLGLFIVTAILSQPLIAAEMSPEDTCLKLGDIAKQASQMRLDGKDMDEALAAIQKADNAGLSEDMVSGAVLVSYAAKMAPDSMRDYYISQCKQDIIR